MADSPVSAAPEGADPGSTELAQLDRLLGAALAPPPLPPAFHAALERRIARERAQELAAAQQALAAEHARAMARLRSGSLNLRPDTLLTIVAGSFTVGAAASVALPSLAHGLGTDTPTLGILLAAAAALGLAGLIVAQRLRPFR